MRTSPVRIERVVRRLRGGSQAQLIEDENGNSYVVKFQHNPQGNRTLINEWIAARLLSHCAIGSPSLQLIELTPDFVALHPELNFQMGNKTVPVKPGIHLGSQCPVSPSRVAIFDLFPSCLLNQVTNIDDFTRTFVIDHLFGQADTRQAIFVRERSDDEDSSYRAWMIDHGFLFGGAEWRIRDMPRQGLHFDKAVYRGADFDALSEEVISKLHTLGADELRSATDEVAGIWLTDNERTELDQLLQSIPARIKAAHEIISFHKNALESIFGKTKRVAEISSVPNTYQAGELRAASALV